MGAPLNILVQALTRYRSIRSLSGKLQPAHTPQLARELEQGSGKSILGEGIFRYHNTLNIPFPNRGAVYFLLIEGEPGPKMMIAKETNVRAFAPHPISEATGSQLQKLIAAKTYEVTQGESTTVLGPEVLSNTEFAWAFGCLLAESLVFLAGDFARNVLVDLEEFQSPSSLRPNCRSTELPLCRID